MSFSDSFNSASATTDIASWPSAGAPDWAYVVGSSGLSVLTGGSCKGTAAFEKIAKVIDAVGAAITGDQKVTCTGFDVSDDSAWQRVCARINATPNFYMAELTSGGAIDLYRYDGGSYTLLAASSKSLSGSYSVYLQAVTNGSQEDLECQADATGAVTYSDTSGSRISSGVGGFGCYDTESTTDGIDSILIESLGGAASYDDTATAVATAKIAVLENIVGVQTAQIGVQSRIAVAENITAQDTAALGAQGAISADVNLTAVETAALGAQADIQTDVLLDMPVTIETMALAAMDATATVTVGVFEGTTSFEAVMALGVATIATLEDSREFPAIAAMNAFASVSSSALSTIRGYHPIEYTTDLRRRGRRNYGPDWSLMQQSESPKTEIAKNTLLANSPLAGALPARIIPRVVPDVPIRQTVPKLKPAKVPVPLRRKAELLALKRKRKKQQLDAFLYLLMIAD